MTHDPLYGAITVCLNRENGVVDISGPAVPRVRIARTWQAKRDKEVPIGTRDAKELTISVEDTPAVITPSRDHTTRRVHMGAVQCTDATYRFEAVTFWWSQLSLRQLEATGQRAGVTGAQGAQAGHGRLSAQ
ncbi:hypothetical protein [Streptomyces cinnamoneus]|uniref:Uncharacterized protein n=1 Tax=Streptomyces cinnamoneus TaxID=53446 RepID=A0A918TGI2_STRCJ|nr:hypothetical protein [Streptomyces cinnamoneus]GHC45331.1 hypothetical protein GCM10010507_20700 [Streptomyces cinnamoneus]